MANKRFMDFTTDNAPSSSAFLLEADSNNGVRKTTIENAVAATNIVANINAKTSNLWDNAAAHNCIYRGKDLTAYFNSGEMSAAIADGSFRDIFPGDYIIKDITIDGTLYGSVKFIVMDCDYHLHCGDVETAAHHVVIMPEERLGLTQMNPINTTVGGYLGSAMWNTHIPKVAAGFVAAFGTAHILEHREVLSNVINENVKSSAFNGWDGAVSDGAWTTVSVNLANENMVFGAPIVASSWADTGDCNSQLAAFQLNHSLIASQRYVWWLRTIPAGINYSIVNVSLASISNADSQCGVRPYALLY